MDSEVTHIIDNNSIEITTLPNGECNSESRQNKEQCSLIFGNEQ